MPPVLPHSTKLIDIVVDEYVPDMTYCMPWVRHVDQKSLTKSFKVSGVKVSIHFGKWSSRVVLDMSFNELRSILVVPVGHEDWDVVHPVVARCRTQDDPLVLLRNLVKSFDPSTCSDQPLFIEDEECAFYILIVEYVVPGVHRDFDPAVAEIAVVDQTEVRCLLFPLLVFTITLLRCSDDIKVDRSCRRGESTSMICSKSSTSDLSVEVTDRSARFTDSHSSLDNTSIVNLLDGFELMSTEFYLHMNSLMSVT